MVKCAQRGGCSLVDKAPGCGPGDRGFESHHSPSQPVAFRDGQFFSLALVAQWTERRTSNP